MSQNSSFQSKTSVELNPDLQILLLLVATGCPNRDSVEVAGGNNLFTEAPPSFWQSPLTR